MFWVSIGFRQSSQLQYCHVAEFLFWVLLLASDGAVRYSIARLLNFCFGCCYWLQTDLSGTVLPDCLISALGVSIGFRWSCLVQYCHVAKFLFWVLLLASDGAVLSSIAILLNFCFGCCYWLQTELSDTLSIIVFLYSILYLCFIKSSLILNYIGVFLFLFLCSVCCKCCIYVLTI